MQALQGHSDLDLAKFEEIPNTLPACLSNYKSQ